MAEKTSELNRADYDAMAAGRTEDLTHDVPPNGEFAAANGGEETEHIKAQIEETRAQMGETIDALQERLSFSNLSEQVSDHVSNAIETATNTLYDATVGKAVGFMKNMGDGLSNSGFVKTAKDNPLPLILIGLGAGLLAYNSFSGSKCRRAGSLPRRNDLELTRKPMRSLACFPRHRISSATSAAKFPTPQTMRMKASRAQ